MEQIPLIRISSIDAVRECRRLWFKHRLHVELGSGAVISAFRQMWHRPDLARLCTGLPILICPAAGTESKVLDDDWCMTHGYGLAISGP